MAIAPPSFATLEARIGFPPHTEKEGNKYQLLASLNNTSSASSVEVKTSLREWLIRQGLPPVSVNAAKNESLATAYTARRYLAAWRKKTNPQWELLNGEDDDAGGDDGGFGEATSEAKPVDGPKPPTAPTPVATPTASETPRASEAWFKDLFKQIDLTVEKLVTARLAATTLKLDDGAKAQIRALAKGAAQERIDELATPRTIEVRNVETNSVVSVGLQHEKFPQLLRAMQARDHKGHRLNIWITGPTGSGKTSAAENAAKALGLAFGSDGSLDADYKVLGFRNAAGEIISTQFLSIYENGGVYVADEIDNWQPSALLSLNAALANGWTASPRGLIRRHPDACVIACANTWGLGATGDYVGRTRLDAASLDRFQPKINWPIDERLEAAIAKAQCEVHGPEWQAKVAYTRSRAKAQGLKVIISPRATFGGIALLQQGFDPQDVIDMTLGAGLSPEQAKAIGLTPQAPQTTQVPEEKSHSLDKIASTYAKRW
jgi:MoxR-like ATPase